MEDFVDAHAYKLYVMLRSRVIRVVPTLIKDRQVGDSSAFCSYRSQCGTGAHTGRAGRRRVAVTVVRNTHKK